MSAASQMKAAIHHRRPTRIAFFALAIAALSSCVTIGAERILAPTPFEQPQWHTLAPGVELSEHRIEEPPLAVYAVRVRTAMPRLRLAVCSRPPGPGTQSSAPEAEATAERTTEFLRRTGARVGVNATPFDPVRKDGRIASGDPVEIVGLSVTDHRLVSPDSPRLANFQVVEDGTLRIRASYRDDQSVRDAAGGFFHVLQSGTAVGEQDFRAPRSAVGIGPDRTTAYLLVADGRQPNRSVGLTAHEVALWLKHFGASEGLLLDGGSSTALAVRRPDGFVRLVNRPVATVLPGVESPVANHLAVFAGPRPASCR